jgi:hypothetical protein
LYLEDVGLTSVGEEYQWDDIEDAVGGELAAPYIGWRNISEAAAKF